MTLLYANPTSRDTCVVRHPDIRNPAAESIAIETDPTHRRLKRRNAVNFTRKLEHNIDLYEAGAIPFAELDASVQGWINHVRYADSWGLRGHIFANHPIKSHPEPQPVPLPRRVQLRRRKQRR